LAASLDLWSSLRRPIQVHEAARGLDDPASAEIFDKVRRLTVSLSNDHEEFETALRLARSLISTFALVPFHRNALERELPVLIGNALNRRLNQICNLARADRSGFARSVSAGGLVRGNGIAGQLAATFADAMESTPDSRANYFLIVRNLAIDLNNDNGDRRTALAITLWLAAHEPPPEIAARLDEDLATLGAEPVGQKAESASGDSAPVVFGRAGGRAAAPAPPRAPPGRRESPPPLWIPEDPPRRRRKAGVLQWMFMAFFAVAYCASRQPHSSHSQRSVEPVVAGPRQSYSTAPTGGREIYEQRLREFETRIANERIRQLDSVPQGYDGAGSASADMPRRPLGTRPRPDVVLPGSRSSGYGEESGR
jgi:hypothetical protein